jgi:dsDNA-binding SOS-regulon protein
MKKPPSNLRTQDAEKAVEAFLSLPLVSEFVFRSPQTVDSSQKEVVDLLISHSGTSVLISQKCQEDPSSRTTTKTRTWANKQAKKAFAQLRGALRAGEAKKAVWCDHRRRGRVEFPEGLPTIDHGIVIVEVFETVELGPENDFPLECNGTAITYFSVNDFLNLIEQLRTLPEILEYLQARQTLPAMALRTIGNEKTLFEYYLLNNGSFDGWNDNADSSAVVSSNQDKLRIIRAAKAESDHYSKLLEYVADQLATRLVGYETDLPSHILSAFDNSAERKNYLQMQEVLANLRLRERAELGRVFSHTVETLKDEQKGFVFRAAYFDAHPDLVFVLASSKGTARAAVLESGLVLTRAAMAEYGKCRAMLIIDRDGSGFEISIGESKDDLTDEDIRVGKRLFGNLRIFDHAYSFVPV